MTGGGCPHKESALEWKYLIHYKWVCFGNWTGAQIGFHSSTAGTRTKVWDRCGAPYMAQHPIKEVRWL